MHMKTAHRVMLPRGPPGSEIGDLSTWWGWGNLSASLGDLQPSDYVEMSTHLPCGANSQSRRLHFLCYVALLIPTTKLSTSVQGKVGFGKIKFFDHLPTFLLQSPIPWDPNFMLSIHILLIVSELSWSKEPHCQTLKQGLFWDLPEPELHVSSSSSLAVTFASVPWACRLSFSWSTPPWPHHSRSHNEQLKQKWGQRLTGPDVQKEGWGMHGRWNPGPGRHTLDSLVRITSHTEYYFRGRE